MYNVCIEHLPLIFFFFVLKMFQLLKSEIMLHAQCSTKFSMKDFNIILKEEWQ